MIEIIEIIGQENVFGMLVAQLAVLAIVAFFSITN